MQARVHLADLVEQQRPTLGLFELAPAHRDRPRERALLMAEQFGFQQRLRQGGAIECHEGTTRPARGCVDMSRQHLLAGPTFAGDEQRGIGACERGRAFHQLDHGRVAVDRRIGRGTRGLEHGGDQVGLGRQGQEILRAGADGAHRGLRIGRATAGDQRAMNALGCHGLEQPGNVEQHVAQDQVRTFGTQPREAGGHTLCAAQAGAARDRDARGLAEFRLQRPDDEQSGHGSAGPIGFDDFRHGDADAVILDHHHLAAGDQAVVDVDVHRLTEFAVEFDHRAAT